MNQQRRKKIREIISQIEIISLNLEGIREDEDMAFDAMPENLQAGALGEAMADASIALEDCISDLGAVNDGLQEIIDK